MSADTIEPVQRGRQRDPSVERRVVRAATEELAEKGFEAFSVRSVARRSGVSRPSLLLRWPDRDSLIIETLASISEWPVTDPGGGLREELTTLVARMVDLLDPTTMAIQLRLIADASKHPELFAAFQHKVMSSAWHQLATLLERAVDRGELPRGIDCRWAADALVGVVFLRTIASPELKPLSAAAQSRLIDSMISTVGAGCRADPTC
ncbi:MAG: TetR/AcrR family transcriptional regulator [Mycobacterium sp.]